MAMSPRCRGVPGTLTPFLYPCLLPSGLRGLPSLAEQCIRSQSRRYQKSCSLNLQSTENEIRHDIAHLNPLPSDYSRTIFLDRATVTLHAGSGGHGCISFLREKYIEFGPANGGDGGYGGNIYIQAVRGETSLHKLARKNVMRAGRGKNGQGKTRGGERGEDIILKVPPGTVIREIERLDPVAVEDERRILLAGTEDGEEDLSSRPHKWDREKWVLYPAITPEDIATADFPSLPKGRRSALAAAQPQAPIALDLSRPMDKPILLAAGAIGGLGNPHFVTRNVPRPKYATKGEKGMRITLALELKLLADVGLVGLPNAGKSTLLRAMSNSRARVGDWAFTTLQPNIGTVVLDDHTGRPLIPSVDPNGELRTNFTIADIPGLVEDAHLDRGLGISFLRHVERARVLAFVIDLNAGNAVAALKSLWKELGEYERMKVQEEIQEKEMVVEWSPFKSAKDTLSNNSETIVIPSNNSNKYDIDFHDAPQAASIAEKPWFVVASKADLPGTQENFQELSLYLKDVVSGLEPHPSGRQDAWCKFLEAVPASAINGHGVDLIRECIVRLLDE